MNDTEQYAVTLICPLARNRLVKAVHDPDTDNVMFVTEDGLCVGSKCRAYLDDGSCGMVMRRTHAINWDPSILR